MDIMHTRHVGTSEKYLNHVNENALFVLSLFEGNPSHKESSTESFSKAWHHHGADQG